MERYELIRSKRKTMSLEVTREGRVRVRAPLWVTQQEIDRFVSARSEWLAGAKERQAAKRAARPEPDENERRTLIERARHLLPDKVARYAAHMGLYPTGISVTGARTRFGSCSGKNRICFSLYLMAYPDEAIDYVVVHELAHIRHKNHGKDFWALVESVMPDYKERRAMLR